MSKIVKNIYRKSDHQDDLLARNLHWLDDQTILNINQYFNQEKKIQQNYGLQHKQIKFISLSLHHDIYMNIKLKPNPAVISSVLIFLSEYKFKFTLYVYKKK